MHARSQITRLKLQKSSCDKCAQAEGIGDVYIARNKSVNKNIYTESGQ